MIERIYPELEQLKNDVEKKIGRSLKSPVDFDLLSYKVSEKTHEQISISTIKRLWGYISTSHMPRLSTLSTLARYIGFIDWDSYCAFLQQEKNIESTFLSEKRILSKDLLVGDRLEIGWNPNRSCVLQYEGNSKFTIIESKNAKIKDGDTFSAEQFFLNQPLIITDLKQKNTHRQNDPPVSYIAGYQTGLTLLSMIK